MWPSHSLPLAGSRGKVHLPRGFTPSRVGSLGFTWTALLAPLSFLQKPAAPTRLLWMEMTANRPPASLWKRAMDQAQALTEKISWSDVAALWELLHSYKCKFLLPTFSGKDEGAKGGPWVENMLLTIPSCKQKLSVSKTRLNKCHSPLTHIRIFIHAF